MGVAASTNSGVTELAAIRAAAPTVIAIGFDRTSLRLCAVKRSVWSPISAVTESPSNVAFPERQSSK